MMPDKMVKLGRLKYGFKLGGKMMGRGTIVVILAPTDSSVQSVFPGIQELSSSTQIAVKFNHLAHPTIIHTSEVEILDD